MRASSFFFGFSFLIITLSHSLSLSLSLLGARVRYAIVRCDRDESRVLCEESFGMHGGFPWLVFFVRGVWSLGTTWEFNGDSREGWRVTPERVTLLRSFVQGWWALKAKETHPFQLRFDPRNDLSRFLWQFVPAISFSSISDLFELRKNASILIIVGSAVVAFVFSSLLLSCCRCSRRGGTNSNSKTKAKHE